MFVQTFSFYNALRTSDFEIVNPEGSPKCLKKIGWRLISCTINLPSFFQKERTMPRNLSGYVTKCLNTSTRFDLNSTAVWDDLFWSFIQFNCNSDFFIFCCISPSIFLVHMITTKSFFGLKRETIRHFVKIVWKDWSWSKTDFLERLKSLQKTDFTCRVCNWSCSPYIPAAVLEIDSLSGHILPFSIYVSGITVPCLPSNNYRTAKPFHIECKCLIACCTWKSGSHQVFPFLLIQI